MTKKQMKAKAPQAVTVIRLAEILEERELVPDQVVKMCKDRGVPITRTTVYNLLSPMAKGIRLDTLTALCVGLEIPISELIVMKQTAPKQA